MKKRALKREECGEAVAEANQYQQKSELPMIGEEASDPKNEKAQNPAFGELKRHRRLTHVSRPSILSSESEANSYRGFLNLGILLLFLSQARLIITSKEK